MNIKIKQTIEKELPNTDGWELADDPNEDGVVEPRLPKEGEWYYSWHKEVRKAVFDLNISKRYILRRKQPTGQDLVGKFCKLWDNAERNCVFGVVIRHKKEWHYPYTAGTTVYPNAKLATREDIEELLKLNEQVGED